MSWLAHHKQSELYASEAELANQNSQFGQSAEFYRLAAEAENLALNALDPTKVRTLGITVVSLAALWYKAGLFDQSMQTAEKWLKNHDLPPFAIAQLKELLETSQKACAKGIAV